MIYPYLLVTHPPYGKFSSYEEASDAIRTGTREECEAFVKAVWVHAYIYEHGREYTVVSMGWRDYARIRDEHPELKIPDDLSATQVWETYNSRWDSEQNEVVSLDAEVQAHRDNYMWKLAALTMIESARTKELEAIGAKTAQTSS